MEEVGGEEPECLYTESAPGGGLSSERKTDPRQVSSSNYRTQGFVAWY